ncbi:site-specific DNA-methyltransferase [Candidatus Woesearchaeota archaeon]|nr:site-specific DNA-methyltransferase [Candidatus Woesearchaeota archaeon]
MKDINEFENRIILGNSLTIMKDIPSGKIDLIFADPPYNIGIKYDTHKDRMNYNDYIGWSEEWIKGCVRLLSDKGSIYIAINDEHVAEIVMILKRLGLTMRNWIVWHYTFGQAQKKKFSRAHTHIVYFTKDKNDFIFNADNIRVKSVRQEIGDKRANPKGKIPDDVWQNGESNGEDVWKISRVAGTFKERVKDFPCQMPVKILERIISVSSNKENMVLDPFSGSGTTAFVSKKLGRKYIGIEISNKYKKMAEDRLKSIL